MSRPRQYKACLTKVLGSTPPVSILDELVDWGLIASDAVFTPNANFDNYSSVVTQLGPYRSIPQPSPHFSYDRESLSQGSVLGDVFAEPLDERPQADLRHVRDQLVEHTALPEQRMGPVFGRVDLEMAIHAEAFASGAEQRQENDGEGVQEKKPLR